MTKKRSKCLFVVFAIILVIALVASFVNFTYPLIINGNYFSYSNFVSNIKLGGDVGNSLRVTYSTKKTDVENYNDLLNSTMLQLKDIVQSEGYTDVTVSSYGDNGIVMNVGNILSKQDEENLINLIGSPASISFSLSQNVEEAIITRTDIKNVEAIDYYNTSSGNHVYYVSVQFKDEKKAEIAELTKNGGTLYIYFGEELFTQMDMGDSGITDGYIYINSSVFTDKSVAVTYANKIKTGMLSLELTNTDAQISSPSYGEGLSVMLSIAIAVLVLVGFVYLIVKYRHMGWIACFNLLFFTVIGLFILQSIPLVTLNLSGFIGLALAYLLSIDTILTVIERAKYHYNRDTQLYIAFNLAQKESLGKVLLSTVLFAIIGLLCLFVPSLGVKSFGWVIFVLSLVTMFTSLVLMRLFTKMYLALNNTDGKKCNFHKGGKNA